MKTIYKYVLDTVPNIIGEPKGVYSIDLPSGAKVLKAGLQNMSDICIWAEVDPSLSKTDHKEIFILGTGWPVIEGIKYLDTIMIEDGVFVYHIYVKE